MTMYIFFHSSFVKNKYQDHESAESSHCKIGIIQAVMDEQRLEVRKMVLSGLEQIKEGKTKDFNEVCDRFEKKYRDAAMNN